MAGATTVAGETAAGGAAPGKPLVFETLTVEDNLILALLSNRRAARARTWRGGGGGERALVGAILAAAGLAENRGATAASLPPDRRLRLDLALALARADAGGR